MVLVPLGNSAYQLSYIEIGLLLIFVIQFFRVFLIRNRQAKVKKNDSIYLFLLFLMIIYSLISYFWSISGITSLVGVTFFIYGFIVVLLSFFYDFKLREYIIANRILLMSLTIQLTINFYNSGQFSNTIGSYYNIKIFSSTLLGDSNYVSMFLTFIFTFEIIAKVKYWFPFTIISGLSIILTMSKGAILALVSVIAIYIFVELISKKNKNKYKNFFSITILGLLFIIAFTSSSLGKQTIQMINYSLNSGFSAGRDILYSSALNTIENNVFGIGYTNIDNPHNFIVEGLRSYGILFGMISTLIFLYPLRHFFNLFRSEYNPVKLALLLSYFGLVTHGLIEIFFYTTPSIIWTMVTILIIEGVFRNEYHDNSEL